MMIQTPNVDSALCRIAGRFWPPYAPIEHLHLFSSRSLRLLLRDVGLQDIQVKTHWKTLPIEYVYQMMQNFGPELRRLITPIYNIIPSALRQACFPFYVGEMLVTARKPMLGD